MAGRTSGHVSHRFCLLQGLKEGAADSIFFQMNEAKTALKGIRSSLARSGTPLCYGGLTFPEPGQGFGISGWRTREATGDDIR